MTDKVHKIREEVERLKSQLVRGACASQMAMETRCKEEAYNEVLAILDTLKKEPVSIDFEQELYKAFGQVKDFTLGMRIAKWFYDMGKNSQDPVSEDLSAEIDTYIKDNFTIAKEQLDRFGIEEKDYMYSMDKSDILTMVKYFTNLQKEKDIKIITDVEAVAFANGMAQMKKQIEEPVSEELNEAALEYANNQLIKSGVTDTNYQRELAVAQASLMVNGFKAGTKWQKEQDQKK